MKITIEHLEAYLADHYCGRATEQSMFMKLAEEFGEVAEVLNRRAGRKSSSDSDLTAELAAELADVIHYTVAIAAINKIDLANTIIQKDRSASIKYNHRINLESFLKGLETV